ncbi:glycosyl hydrolase family 28-related protein [Kitasatospora griseola]
MQNSRRTFMLGGLAASAVVAAGASTEAAAATGPNSWLNVRDDHGAKGDGTTDDTTAIQAAINAGAQGSTVYFPPGRYLLSRPLLVTEGVTLRGDWAPHFAPRTSMTASYLFPGPGFDGSALITVNRPTASVPQDYEKSALGGGVRLSGLALNGMKQSNAAGGPIDAVVLAADVRDVAMERVTAWHFTGNGITTGGAGGLQFHQVVCSTNDGHGFATNGGRMLDADLHECYAQGNGGHGFALTAPNAVVLTGCRSEWNAGHGYLVTGDCASLVLAGCFTDRSGLDGYHVATDAGAHPVQLLGCLAKRDGKLQQAGSAGFSVTGVPTAPGGGALLTGCSVYTGVDDDGSNVRSPAYGVATASLASFHLVTVTGGQFMGTVAPFRDQAGSMVRHSGATGITDPGPAGGGWQQDRSDTHVLNGAKGTNRDLQFWTRGSAPRWTLRVDSAPESGGNSGSDLRLLRHDDSGNALDSPLAVDRATGLVALGQGLRVREGAGARLGTVTLSGGQAQVNTTAVTANSRILLTIQRPIGTTSGAVWVTDRAAGSWFKVQGAPGDNSLVAWMIVEPA